MITKIQAESASGQPPYEHLLPITNFLINHGNAISPLYNNTNRLNNGFYCDKDGWVCDLSDPINFNLLLREFEFPKTIRMNEIDNTLSCDKSWIQIRGNIK